MIDLSRLYVQHGGADTNEFWDVSFEPVHLEAAGTQTDGTTISVSIDSATGAVALNAGYMPDSPQGRDELLLWGEYEQLIVEALYREIDRGQDNDAFLDRAEADASVRAERIADVVDSLEDVDA